MKYLLKSIITIQKDFKPQCFFAGFAVTKTFKLNNKTQVPIQFSISVKGDGLVPSVTSQEYSVYKSIPPYRPKEFSFQPVDGVVAPYTVLNCEVRTIHCISIPHFSTIIP